MNDALLVLEGFAFSEGTHEKVYVRLAEHEGCIYLDLGDDAWNVVKIGSAGWQVIPAAKSPTKFIRPRGMRPLPRPETGGSLNDLKDFINVHDSDLPLVFAWLVAGSFNCTHDIFNGIFIRFKIRCKTAFITDCGIESIFL